MGLKKELSIIKQDFLALRKELSEITYQLSMLYDRWSVEHQHMGKREAEMSRSIEIFNKKTEGLENRLQNIVVNVLSEQISKVERWAKYHFEQQANEMARRLEQALNKVDDIMSEYANV